MYKTFTRRKMYGRAFHVEDMNNNQGREIRTNTWESFKCLLCAKNCWMIYNYIHLSLTTLPWGRNFHSHFFLIRTLNQIGNGNILGHRDGVINSQDIHLTLKDSLFLSYNTYRKVKFLRILRTDFGEECEKCKNTFWRILRADCWEV